MPRLTRTQIQQLKKIIEEHMDAIMYIAVGDTNVSPALSKKLGLSKELCDVLSKAYKYGKACKITDADLMNIQYNDAKKFVDSIKLTPTQKHGIEMSKIITQQSIDNLTQKITSTVISSAVQSDIDMYTAVKEVVPQAIEDQTPRYKVVQELREKTDDWQRDYDRVAHTELWSAKCQGEVQAIIDGESPFSKDGVDTKIYIRPREEACKHCKELYLEKDGITPKVFTITELRANGNNRGRKTAEWKPVIPPLHPSCLCPINVMPSGTHFNDSGELELD